MKSKFTKILSLLMMLVLVLATVGCGNEEENNASTTSSTKETKAADVATKAEEEPEMTVAERAKDLIKARNIRVVIGSSSTGGDTYQSSSLVATKLEEVLGKKVKVDATGASAAFDALEKSSDGSTIMIFHDQAYLGYLYGKDGYMDIFREWQVGPSTLINPGNAFAVAKDSKFNTAEDIINACGNGEQVRVAIQPGGVSEIGYSALKNAVKVLYPGMEENLVAVNSGSQSEKNQAMWDGLADCINASVQGNTQFTLLDESDPTAMKFVWLTAGEETVKQANEAGYDGVSRDELLQYVYPNVSVAQDESSSFTFDKEFVILYNKDMSQDIVDLFDDALAEVFADEAFIQSAKDAFFIPNFRSSAESEEHFLTKMGAYKGILEDIGATK